MQVFTKRGLLCVAVSLSAFAGKAQSNVVAANNGSKQITLEDLYQKGTFGLKSVPGFNAMKDGERYSQVDGKQINIYRLKDGQKLETVFDLGGLEMDRLPAINSFDSYEFSADETKLLVFTESQNIYRRSVLHKVYVYDLKTRSITLLDMDKVLHASFSPDGSKVGFVKGNNLYYRDLTNGKTVAVTTDGETNSVINGNCDWVYEEEFEFTQAYQWSPDGKYMAYYRFDESGVPEYTMTVYDSLYPTPYKYKYPKAGEPNSEVTIRIYDVAKHYNQTTSFLKAGDVMDYYIPRIKWTKDAGKLCIYKMNRLQNELKLLLADAATGATSVIYTEKNPAYVEVNDNLQFLGDGESFILNSEIDGYNHLYRVDWKKHTQVCLTPGNFDIDQLVGIDDAKNLVLYTAAKGAPMERKLYSCNLNGKHTACITPEVGTHAITPCTGNAYFLDKFSSLRQVPVYTLRDTKGKIVRTLETNDAAANRIAQYELGSVELMTIKNEAGVPLNAYMIKPPHFDGNKKYPVLMFQYSGPGSQQVADKFPLDNYFWHQMLAEKGYIIVCADGTGTGFRGEAFKKKTYLQLGKYESDDQIAVAKYLGTLPFVAKERIGIWGWSFGAFMSSTCIMKGADVFKMAVAVAPVTNWRYYDNIYTERYMRRPQDNEKGYDDNAPEKMADKLKGKFLLIHGTGDDNVHFQNSVSLVNNLIKANKDYDSEYYPNRNHGIGGGNTRLHLFRRITQFILDNL